MNDEDVLKMIDIQQDSIESLARSVKANTESIVGLQSIVTLMRDQLKASRAVASDKKEEQ